MTRGAAVVAVIGGGPRGVGLLERLLANAAADPERRPVDIHVIDPYPVGGGRVWRADQSPLLLMNSMAEDVTMFLDDSVTADGPPRPGPSLAEWAARPDLARWFGPGLVAEIATVGPRTFPSRQVQSAYLSWFLSEVTATAPDHVTVLHRSGRVLDLRDLADGRQRLSFDDGVDLDADVVLLALGHLDAEPSEEEEARAAVADRHGLRYLPRAFTADQDLSALRPQEDVILSGFGAAFIDLMVLLTEGRGGRYVHSADGTLVYEPSGAEPVLHVGSRRGVPFHAKLGYRLVGRRAPLPRFLTAEAVDVLLREHPVVEFDRDLLPLVRKDVAFAYYHELFTAHPDRVRVPWDRFEAQSAPLAYGSSAYATLVASAVPDPDDRFDLDRLAAPLRGSRVVGDALQAQVRAYVERDVARRSDDRYSADHGAFDALLSVLGQIVRVLTSGQLSARSLALEFPAFFGFFSFYASGPPPHRLQELLALHRAGVLRFLGADLRVEADADAGRWVARSSSTDDVVTATALVESRLPSPTVSCSADPLLRTLYERGEIAEEWLTDEVDGVVTFTVPTGRLLVRADDGRVVDRSGRAHDRRYAFGWYTSGFSAAAFSRPRTNAPFFRQNDRVAREVLDLLAEPPLAVAEPTVAGRS